MKTKDCFDTDGNFRIKFDPFRIGEDSPAIGIYNHLFDEDGNLHNNVMEDIYRMVKVGNYHVFSDIVKLLHANDFAMNTKGNYSAIYMWR